MSSSHSSNSRAAQTMIGAGVALVGVAMGFGAIDIRAGVGYAGIGPNFLPWAMACALLLCGGLLVWHARSGGFREMEEGSGAAHGDWPAIGWVSVGILVDAALITTAGFILANALCFALAVRGLRASEGKPAGGPLQVLVDLGTGLAIAAPAFWLFTKVLAINLPGLTGTGWI